MGIYDRTKILLSGEEFERLRNARVLVVGVGGVGGYAVEILARAGIGSLTLIDGDRIDGTNINRQIIATSANVGCYKTDEYKKRIESIDSSIEVKALNVRFNKDTADEILSNEYDYIIDAIDSVNDKVELIAEAHKRGLKIISAMGAGNRIAPADFEVIDIYKTSYDKLARKMRKLLREKGVARHNTVCCKEPSTEAAAVGAIGSISYMPALAGVKLGAFVVNELIKGGKSEL